MNRLVTATSNQNWGETYTYDGFGNLTGKTPTGTAPALSIYVDPMTNCGGGSFDANGNQTQITIGGQQYTALYDVGNRMASIGVFWGPSMAYAYDPQNRRVWSWDPAQQDSYGNPTLATVYFYGVDGSRLGAYGVGFNNYAAEHGVADEWRAVVGCVFWEEAIGGAGPAGVDECE